MTFVCTRGHALGLFWCAYVSFGVHWVSFRVHMALLVCICLFWCAYGSFGVHMSLLVCICLFWCAYGSFGVHVSLLVCICLFWCAYVSFVGKFSCTSRSLSWVCIGVSLRAWCMRVIVYGRMEVCIDVCVSVCAPECW